MQKENNLIDLSYQGYIVEGKLGTGAYGRVYRARTIKGNQLVAIKTISLEAANGKYNGVTSTCMREINCLTELKGRKGLVQLISVFMLPKSKTMAIVMELLPYDLGQYLESVNYRVSTEEVKLIMYQLFIGLKEMHSLNYLHRDIKMANILIDPKTMIVKLADFGLSRQPDMPFCNMTNEIETPYYRPLEIALGATSYTSSIDVWTLGIVFYELYSGKRPFKESGFSALSDITVVFNLLSALGTPTEADYPNFKNLPFYSPHLPKFKRVPPSVAFPEFSKDPDALDLLSRMLMLNPARRISPSEALKHPFFFDIEKHFKSIDVCRPFCSPSHQLTRRKEVNNSGFGK